MTEQAATLTSNLTSPRDRGDVLVPTTPAQLSHAETQSALNELYIKPPTENNNTFSKRDRTIYDPPLSNLVYCLHSFIPSKGATPDEDGIYGFMKCRGAFSSTYEADKRSEWLIRNVDSYHPIQMSYVGRPFPVCKDTKKYISDTREIDIREKAVETISDDIKARRRQEKENIQDIKSREKKLLDESRDDYVKDSLEIYTETMVKKAQLLHVYTSTMKKLKDEVKPKIVNVFKEIQSMDTEFPTYAEQYRKRYDTARKEAGMPVKDPRGEDNWLRFLGNDHIDELDFDPSAPLNSDYEEDVPPTSSDEKKTLHS